MREQSQCVCMRVSAGLSVLDSAAVPRSGAKCRFFPPLARPKSRFRYKVTNSSVNSGHYQAVRAAGATYNTPLTLDHWTTIDMIHRKKLEGIFFLPFSPCFLAVNLISSVCWMNFGCPIWFSSRWIVAGNAYTGSDGLWIFSRGNEIGGAIFILKS